MRDALRAEREQEVDQEKQFNAILDRKENRGPTVGSSLLSTFSILYYSFWIALSSPFSLRFQQGYNKSGLTTSCAYRDRGRDVLYRSFD